jgi:pimeloyl-ACP methyl ester carboxylesterase
MATFVLVHGSYHGGWCWQKVARLLRQHGHDVYTPTLTGLGERSHLCTPQVGLDLHIRDITQVLEYEDLREVMLTGHSYGGMVITGVAAACPQRLARLIYLDAFVPQDGQSVFDLRPGMQERWEGLAAGEGQGWRVPPPDAAAMGVSNAADAAWVQPRLTPMPLATHQQPLRLPSGPARQVLRTYILCRLGGFQAIAQAVQAQGWDYYELETGHDAPITMPDELARVLDATAGSTRG